MRHVLRAVTLDLEPGDISTIEEESSIEEARHVWHQLKKEIAR
jgi:acetyl-CoA synthetase